MASTYHGNTFFGFSACLPRRVIPDWIYYPILCPSGPVDKEKRLKFSSYGLRKVEAALLASGFTPDEVIVAHPDHLRDVVGPDTKIVAVSSHDPLGIGPATSTYSKLLGGEGRMVGKLREFLQKKIIRRYGSHIVLGGPGAWQLSVYPGMRKKLGVDTVLYGEGEIAVPALFKRILAGDSDVPEVVEGKHPGDTIPDIVNPTIAGLIEATRGCVRRCAYCVPSLRRLQSMPIETILREVKVNVDAGIEDVLLHGEDILLYRSDGLKVNSDAVAELFDSVYRVDGVKNITASHASFSSAVSAPESVQSIAQILELGSEHHPMIGVQVGIETGSQKLISRHMKGKAYPFGAEAWPDVVRDGMKLYAENQIVCVSTIILGLPGEETEDILQTLDLIKSLRPYQSIIVPLLFAPLKTTKLESARSFDKPDMSPEHHALFAACWDHNIAWARKLWEGYSHYSRKQNPFIRPVIDLAMKVLANPVRTQIHRNARRHGAVLEYENEY